MLKTLKAIYVILFYLLLASCNTRTNNETVFNKSSFNESLLLKEASTYKYDSLLMGDPRWIRFHPDSFLIIQDMQTEKAVSIIDLKNSTIQKIIAKGKGPGEAIMVYGIEILERDLYVYDFQLKKNMIYTVDSNRKFRLKEEIIIEDKATSYIMPLNKSTFVGINIPGNDAPYTLINKDGKTIENVGSYPPLQNENEIKPNNLFLHGYLTASPNGERFLRAYSGIDVIDIYDLGSNTSIKKQGPICLEFSAEKKPAGNMFVHMTVPRYTTYWMADSNNDEFWVGYSGFHQVSGERPTVSDILPEEIFCFNWDGEPLRKITFNHSILCFDVDWETKTIYTLALEGEFAEIVVFRFDS